MAIEELNKEELEKVAGGKDLGQDKLSGWVTVTGLLKGYLALRTAPYYDSSNEIKGSESYNGDTLLITGGYAWGADGRQYVWVYNPRTGMSGYTHASYLQA